ncbi:ribonuclease HIII [Mycoplasma sp. 744]|uniref:ribonuclease HIII n=1 Tax=Mycoplasma sp. 744 TaxID=3108531 RepID=UPI002B1D69F1|nr:ribonuclease HIII [Mycoplasma sp. 744]MEA4115712.1 ribonuclease HIII [Mycoplasma sp. 744]
MQIVQFSLDLNLKNKIVIGIDETGVGDYFGPLVACAAFVPKNKIEEIINLGIKDSKKISDKKILEIAHILKEKIYYSTAYFSTQEYNILNKKYNANEIKMLLHLKALWALKNTLKNIDYIFIDQYSTIKTIMKYYFRIKNDFLNDKIAILDRPVILDFKAEDKNLNVSCASVLARALFLELMEQKNNFYQVIFPLGAGENVKLFAKNFFQKNNKNLLEIVAKNKFKMELD